MGVSGAQDRLDPLRWQGTRYAMGSRGPILEPGLALRLEPAHPFPRRLSAHARHVGCVGDGHPVNEDPIDQQPPAEHRELGPTMCHESLPFDVSWIPTPSTGRLSLVKNLFVNHS